MSGGRFNAPPGWPAAPPDWRPAEGWQAPPEWPPAPPGWQFWIPEPEPAAAAAPERRRSRYRTRWLYLYRAAIACYLVFLALALTGEGVTPSNVAGLVLGLVSAAGGLTMAEVLHRRGCDDVTFDSATQGLRVVAVAWAALVIIMIVTVMIGTGLGTRTSAGAGANGLVEGLFDSAAGTLFGLAALLLVAGDGYTKFRQALLELRSGTS
ncbi:hypothetical protein [Pseudactinotalea suaedae]|uniref:hypothetical protein n=1 Tax=Pseudactinotalea suaedae TaxID=1524924 RepID=UPI0012E27BDD|nr:hypothetical protein [Pseudactinotalea suaedae]